MANFSEIWVRDAVVEEEDEVYDDDFIHDYEIEDREWTDEDEAGLEEYEIRKRERIAEQWEARERELGL